MSDAARNRRTRDGKFDPDYLRRFGFAATTIFDIGVGGRGTPVLYETFAGRKVVLVDPQRGVKERLHSRRPDTRGFDFHEVALGSSPGTAVLKTFANVGRTSLSERPGLQPVETYEVPVTTLDALIETGSYKAPFGIKIDAEGHEMEVIAGATDTLKNTEFVIAEVSVRRRFAGGYRFSDMIALMASRGFELIDVLNVEWRIANFLDCVFMPAEHPLFTPSKLRKGVT